MLFAIATGPFLMWVESTSVAMTISQSSLLTGFISALHLVGLALLMGGVFVSSLRLTGLLLPDRPAIEVTGAADRGILLGLAIRLASCCGRGDNSRPDDVVHDVLIGLRGVSPMKSIVSLCFAMLLLSALPLAGHDGHDEVSVLVGTVTSVGDQTIEVETFDQTMMQLKRVSILLDAKTRFLLGKKRVETLELALGQRIDCTVRREHARDDSIRLRALQIRRNEPKKTPSTSSTR